MNTCVGRPGFVGAEWYRGSKSTLAGIVDARAQSFEEVGGSLAVVREMGPEARLDARPVDGRLHILEVEKEPNFETRH
jgi:hypothetical protein